MSRTIYDSRRSCCKQPFGAAASGQTVTFTLHLPKTLAPDAVLLRIYPMDDWAKSALAPMAFTGADLLDNRYRCAYPAPSPGLYAYYFEVRSEDGIRCVKRQPDNTGSLGDGGFWQLTVYDEFMKTPSCLREGVIYQIFPDRFCRSGQPKRDVPADRVLREDWGGLPFWRPENQGAAINTDYFGGDLKGITSRLDYIQELGVSVMYLNPIFEAHSNHRYNTADYRRVDPLLGDEEDFRALCHEAKKRGIAVILDGVFSHTGSDSVYFNKKRRYGSGGAYNDPASPYRSWYRFTRYPEQYESWWNFKTLPNVEECDPSYLDFICGENGVLRHWMRLGASGFRLDVADELPDVFLDRLRACVKEENPDAVIIGEVWEDASNKVSYGVRRRYLLGSQLDSVMNYPFKDALLAYIRDGGGAAFYATVMQILENYPPTVIPALMNSLSTHDTPRAITALCAEPLGSHGREWQESHHYLPIERYHFGKRLLVLATVLQYGLPGMPCIYYGDEAGLSGYKDPFNRVCYPWGYEDDDLLTAFRALGAIRREYPYFSQAAFIPITFGNHICAFERCIDGRHLLFAVNRSDQRHFLAVPRTKDSPHTLFQWGGFRDGYLEPYSGVVLRWLD